MKTMLKSRLLYWPILFPMLILMAGCGGGGGGSGSGTASTGPDTTPPAVLISAPTNKAVLVGTATISVSATDNVGVTKAELYVNGVLQATDTASPHTFSWDTTMVADGSYTLTVKAYDEAGNVGESAAIAVIVDNLAPTVTSTSPADGAPDVPVDTTLSVTFSEPMNPLTLSSGIQAMVSWTDNNTKATLKPSTSLDPSSTYTSYIMAKDLAGNSVSKTWSFTTAP